MDDRRCSKLGIGLAFAHVEASLGCDPRGWKGDSVLAPKHPNSAEAVHFAVHGTFDAGGKYIADRWDSGPDVASRCGDGTCVGVKGRGARVIAWRSGVGRAGSQKYGAVHRVGRSLDRRSGPRRGAQRISS